MLCLSGFELYSGWVPLITEELDLWDRRSLTCLIQFVRWLKYTERNL